MAVEVTWFTLSLSLLLDVVPRQVYLHLLLRFPSLYFSRVTRIFQDADLGMGEIKRMALEAIELDKAREGLNQKLLYQGVFPQDWKSGADAQPVSYMNLRNSWQAFIDSLMREWKTLNIVSVLLLSAILTILQIESAAANPLTRFSALLSLICAFMSLIYGCLYIIRFGTMRKTHKAAEWANESERTSTSIFWNVWVMLSMPAVWLGWSMIFYIICVMSFVWQTGTVSQRREYLPTDLEILIPRIVISCILALGFIYLVLVVATFSRYSDPMEQAWQARIRGWLAEKTYAMSGHYPHHVYPPHGLPIGTTQPGRPYDARQAKTGDGAKEMAYSNTKSRAGNADSYQAPQVKSRELHASGPIRETNAREQPKPKSMPNFASTSRTVPLSHGGIQTAGDAFVNAFQANRNQDLDWSPFIPELRTPEKLEGQAGLIPTVQPTPIRPSRSIQHLDLASAPYASGDRQAPAKDDTGTSTPVEVPDSEHPRHFISARKDEVSGNCVATIVAVPLRDASTVDGESVALEEMEEVYKFDLRVKDVQDSEGRVGRHGLVESKALTLRMSGTSIPLPRQLLEEGLAVPTWERFCKDIFSAWRCVVEDRTNALSDMIGVVSAWNDHLEFFGVFLALVQFDDTAHVELPTPPYSLYLGPRGAVRVGVRTPGSSCRPFRLAHNGFQVSESGLPEMIGLVGGNDAVLKFSDGAHGGDAECPVEDRE